MNWVCRYIFCIAVFLLLIELPAKSQDANLVVIANGTGAPSEMKMAQLKSAMRGEKQRWPDGSKVIIALMKTNTPIGMNTSKKVYNMTPDELNKYWLALVFQGKADAPNFFNTESELEDFIAQTRGAIGVVSQAPAATKSVTIDGKKIL